MEACFCFIILMENGVVVECSIFLFLSGSVDVCLLFTVCFPVFFVD